MLNEIELLLLLLHTKMEVLLSVRLQKDKQSQIQQEQSFLQKDL
jgi:hypothetical protein